MVLLTFAFLMFELNDNDNAVQPVKIQTAKYITAKFN